MTTGSELGFWVGRFPSTSSVSPQFPAWLTPQLKKPGRVGRYTSAEGQLQAPLWLRAAQEANLSLLSPPLTPQCLPPPPFPQTHRPLSLDLMWRTESPHPQSPIIFWQEHTVSSGPEGGVCLKDQDGLKTACTVWPALRSTVQRRTSHQNVLLSIGVQLLSPHHCNRT